MTEREAIDRLRDALHLPLLFYDANWDTHARLAWLYITGVEEATTKVMCDHIRKTLNRVSEGLDPNV